MKSLLSIRTYGRLVKPRQDQETFCAGADDLSQGSATKHGSPLAEPGGQGERVGGSGRDEGVKGVGNIGVHIDWPGCRIRVNGHM